MLLYFVFIFVSFFFLIYIYIYIHSGGINKEVVGVNKEFIEENKSLQLNTSAVPSSSPRLKLKAIYRALACADDINLLGVNTNPIKKLTVVRKLV